MGAAAIQGVLNYAQRNKGKRVFADVKGARGECWDLAFMALKESGAKTPHDYGRNPYKWSDTKVSLNRAAPGDIIQYKNLRIEIYELKEEKAEKQKGFLEKIKKAKDYLEKAQKKIKEVSSQIQNIKEKGELDLKKLASDITGFEKTSAAKIAKMMKEVKNLKEKKDEKAALQLMSEITKLETKHAKELANKVKKLKDFKAKDVLKIAEKIKKLHEKQSKEAQKAKKIAKKIKEAKDKKVIKKTLTRWYEIGQPRHTAIIKAIKKDGIIEVYEQNMGGKKETHINEYYLKPGIYKKSADTKIEVVKKRGSFIIYRAEVKR